MLAALVLSLVRPSILMRTLAMKNIAEVRMKRQWKVRRQFSADHECRAAVGPGYQHLLEWTLPIDPVSDQLASFRPPAEAEGRYEDCDLSTSIDQPADQGSND